MLKKILNKYIQKCLDRNIKDYLDVYYFENLKRQLRGMLSKYMIDYRYIEESSNYICLEIKNQKYLDDYYNEIYTFRKDECLLYLLEFKEIEKEIEERIKKYFKYEK